MISQDEVYYNESDITKVCFEMEWRGIKIDRQRVIAANAFEKQEAQNARAQFRSLTGRDYKDSNKVFKEVFDELGETYAYTDKGNPSFKADVLVKSRSPIASIINKVRYHEKRSSTYYENFLLLADRHDIIHFDSVQSGTSTGRFSYRNPNLQNVPKEDEEEDQSLRFHVRESFIPRGIFIDIDYKQQEYRVMLDYAGQMDLISQIKDGADVHQATAELMGVTRKQAKTLNFMILYGGGIQKLADSLGVEYAEAEDLYVRYFSRLPKVRRLIFELKSRARRRGYVFTGTGRRLYSYLPGSNEDISYRIPNHFIQSTCADVVKKAMVEIYKNVQDHGLVLQVHDELLFDCEKYRPETFDQVKKIMEGAYTPQNGLHLEVDFKHSAKSWGFRDLKEGMP